LVCKKQSAISNAIDAKVVHKDIAQLLESISNIKLEVAKRIAEQEINIKVETAEEIPEPEEAEQERRIQPAGNPEIYETLYLMKTYLKSKRKSSKPTNENQLSLF